MATDPLTPPLEALGARLEQALIEEYLAAHGASAGDLQARTDPGSRQLLKDAAIYAAGKLTEVESRAHLVHDLHHGSETG